MAKKRAKKKDRSSTFILGIVLFLSSSALFLNLISDLPEDEPLKSVNFLVSSLIKTPTPTPLPPINKPANSPQPAKTPHMPQRYGKEVYVPILYYHYIGENPNKEDKARDNLSIDPKRFDEELAYLAQRGYTPITLDMLYSALKTDGALPAKSVVLTFDDGYIDFYVNAYPILKKYNFQATVFIPTGLVGTGYYMTWDQIKEMSASGIILFQAHSVGHLMLTELDEAQLSYQIMESKKTLEGILGKPVNFFAYPYGVSNPYIWKKVAEAGYLGGIGTWYSKTISEGFIFDMPRIKVTGGITIENFAQLL